MQRLVTALIAVTLAWGCKDDSESTRKGDSGANSASAHLPGDKALGDLSESETVELCEQLRSTTDDSDARRGTCVIAASVAVDFANSGGGTTEEVLKECEDQLATCLDEEPKPCQPIRFTDDCKATVDDFSECSRIAAQQLSELASRSCEDVIEQSGRGNASDADAGTDAGADAGARDGGVGVGITSGLEGKLERCSTMLNACTPGT